jgi:hypothetical protein
MKERVSTTPTDWQLAEEIFACRLPGSEIKPITFPVLPERIRKYIGQDRNLGLGLKIDHQDQTTTFVGEDSSCEIIYLQDRDNKNLYLGEGQVCIENVEDELYIPVVAFTQTTRNQRKKGYGTRRLAIMNSLTKLLYDEPLFSSTSPKLKQRSVWERLVEQEYAEVFEFGGVKRFKFT